MSKILIFIKILLSILLIGCLFKMNYGYYQLVRFFGMVSFGILAFLTFENNKVWFIIWLSSAILINPIFKIALGREIWNIIDIIWSILLIITIFLKSENEYNELK